MKKALTIYLAAISLASGAMAQNNSTKLTEAEMKKLRSEIINQHENHRTNTMDWAQFNRYAKDNKAIANKPKVVLMGNSITQGWVEQHNDWLLSHNILGRGISGQVSSQMLVRFRQDVIALKPDKVVILCGINDIALNQGPIALENVMGNIISMVELAKLHKIKPYLCSLTPAKRIGWRPQVSDTPAQVKQLNAMIYDYAKKNNVAYIDYFSLLVDKDGESMISSYTGDGLHPNIDGYKIMEGALLKALKIK